MLEMEECKVCGDQSTGKHYGVDACESCRLFFKRSVRKHVFYNCRYNKGSCLVDKQHRNMCQFCRMKRCLHVGMREGIPDSKSTERRRRAQLLPRFELNSCQLTGSLLQETNGKVPKALPTTPFSSLALDIRRDASDNIFPENFIETASRWLFMSIKWAKSLPYFAELYYPDQLELLRQNWSKLFLFNLMYFEMVPHMESDKVYKELFVQWSQINLKPDMPGKLDQCLEKIRRLQMDETETLLIKSLLLFNPGG